ncbi:hypothetical protein BEL04_10855 [Mucilaginibacter sp. PPCGB 2223]|uniref:hypothetical protein n=1 Tax=Mucilaginibacter sp. PPCGB 2223 TaxID=1886027 RepID=UPI000825EF86|nr:hypothetical protein [Mucilaginibacter sp. PPCGB 2223]OCX54715.1 hypothetical protein BEL04_10855 [Mucilaginibacter sp. PPCGB 2223]
MDTENSTPAALAKKAWMNPELTLISKNPVIGSKTFPQVHEGTGAYVTFAVPHQYKNFSNAAQTFGINITSNGAPVGGNKTQAFS